MSSWGRAWGMSWSGAWGAVSQPAAPAGRPPWYWSAPRVTAPPRRRRKTEETEALLLVRAI